MKKKGIVSYLLFFLLLVPFYSQEVDNKIHFRGQNTVHFETYRSIGNSTPYQATGFQSYDEFHLNINKYFSEYKYFNINLDFLYNNSAYRANRHGFIPERFNYSFENGESRYPFRLQIGDIFPFTTIRTFQRNIKGIFWEIQPRQRRFDRRESILLFLGSGQSDYESFSLRYNEFAGFSFLQENNNWWSYSLNAIYNHKAPQDGLEKRDQTVYSITASRRFKKWRQIWDFEGEAGLLKGDFYDGNLIKNTDSKGYYLNLNGIDQKTKLRYSIRREIYGKYYKPEAAIIQNDYKAWLVNASYLFKNKYNFRLRHQYYVNAATSPDLAWTKTNGFTFTGPFKEKNGKTYISGNLDTYIQSTHRKDLTVYYHLKAVNLNLSFRSKLNNSLALRWREINDHSPNDRETERVYEANYNVNKSYKLKNGILMALSPGVYYQYYEGNDTDKDNYGINLAMNLSRKNQSLGLSVRHSFQDPHIVNSANDMNDNFTLNYKYLKGDKIFGIDGILYLDNQDPGNTNRAYKIAFYLTKMFDESVVGWKNNLKKKKQEFSSIPYLLAGQDWKVAQLRLKKAGMNPQNGIKQGNWIVFEKRLYDEILERQRVAYYVNKKGIVKGTLIIIDFDDPHNPIGMAERYSRNLEILMKTFGSPDKVYKKGEFSKHLMLDIYNGTFSRVVEWNLPGGILRFGIPYRTDGIVRMELQFKKRFPPITSRYESVEEIRD